MQLQEQYNKNILLKQVHVNDDNFTFKEHLPALSDGDFGVLTFSDDIRWSSIKSGDNINISYDASNNIIISAKIDIPKIDAFKNTPLFFKENRMGIGREPLYHYIVDIATPIDTVSTALHIGDGINGFSFGNATSEGFLPQIIGLGADKDDAGLYFLGKSSSKLKSSTPVIIFDGRNKDDTILKERPILGISNGSYTDFEILVDAKGRMGIGKTPKKYKLEVEDSILVHDVLIDTDTSTLSLISELNFLKDKIALLESKINAQ